MLSITASDLPRIKTCNGSRLMVGFESTIKADNSVRDEGIAAHWVAQQIHSNKFNAEELIDRKAPNGVYITDEITEDLHDYLKAIGNSGEVEKEMSFSGSNWIINSRPDHVIFESNVLYINDFKYGWSIVQPHMNWTLIAHALAFIANSQQIPEKIVFTIYQPRPYHIDGYNRSWEITYHELVQFYNEINNTLSNPKDELQTSVHCKNCPALATCPAARKAELNAIDASEALFETEIDDLNLSFRLDQLSRAIKVLEQNYDAYSEIALHRVKSGRIINNYGIVDQLSNRAWKGGVTVEFLQVLTGKDLSKKKLITPKQAENEGVDPIIVSSLTERFNKGIKLTRIDANKKAEKIFNNNKKGK